MDEGELIAGDELFFVTESSAQSAPKNMWHDLFQLRKGDDDKLHAPSFLCPAATSIFNAGKNIVMLKKLGAYEIIRNVQSNSEPSLEYGAICPAGFDMVPFPELFDAAFDKWIQSKYQRTSTVLRDVLFDTGGLSLTLKALDHIYLMSDGSASSSFCEEVFDKMAAHDHRWHNQHILTAAGQEVFAPYIDSARLKIMVESVGMDLQRSAILDSVRNALPAIKIRYRLPWPVQIIVSSDGMEYYQMIFTLLLQVRMALQALQKHKMLHEYHARQDAWGEDALFYSSRNNLLWFCTTIQSYLSTLVLTPHTGKLRQDLKKARDVDAMITIHTRALKQMVDEACLEVGWLQFESACLILWISPSSWNTFAPQAWRGMWKQMPPIKGEGMRLRNKNVKG